MIDICSSYVNEHNTTFNVNKTVCMKFFLNYSKTKDSYPEIFLDKRAVGWVDTYCYLGYDVNNSCKKYDDCEINRKCHYLKVKANMLATRFSHASDNVKCLLFKTYFSNIYCCSLWVVRTKKIVEKIRVAYNDCLRIIFKIKGPHSITKELATRRVNGFESLRRKNCFSLNKRVFSMKMRQYKTL